MSGKSVFLKSFNRDVIVILLISLFISCAPCTAQTIRKEISLNENWRTDIDEHNQNAYKGFERLDFDDHDWKKVNVPHNWDQYEGYRRLRHGNKHGYAWYRKTFTIEQESGKRYFLFFEGVGSYATVWLNGIQIGIHKGGRTTFTLDATEAIRVNQPNLLAVRADHPQGIKDLPWVCGGCSDERGFSEGSQPMGIFRPVRLIITSEIKVEPFGVHIWNDTTVNSKSAKINLTSEIKNYGAKTKKITIVNTLYSKECKKIAEIRDKKTIGQGQTALTVQILNVSNPTLWTLENPYLYDVVTEVFEGSVVLDRIKTPYGIRSIKWPELESDGNKQFLLNGKPVFINGIAEYEHLLGNSHAFSDTQIRTRVLQIKGAGFNAFRDAHQPHNLRYQENWDSLGILSWTQMSAHVWYDDPEFRSNFKVLIEEWVKERRNSPSVVLWGLQNESKLPEDFAKECTELIRKLDPTASAQRKITTCNGGAGTDWDVPQNWTGTYGGDPKTYGKDLQRQVLVGEYGAWRTLDLHTEGPFKQDGPVSEERITQLMELKVRLADSVKKNTAGHFFWLFTSHDNPGRIQGGEGFREMDRIGPVNYKGLLTPWEEPLDVYYMFRSNFASKEKEPMVYIASHTWPSRWTTAGVKNGISVYSNCDEVELFNDINNVSLGKRRKNGIGSHFQWDSILIKYNILYAIGYVRGREVAKDYIVLQHLPDSPGFQKLVEFSDILKPQQYNNYLYRVNCGGPDYKDKEGNLWNADVSQSSPDTWGSRSWTNDFERMPLYFASQRRTFDPIKGTSDWKLFQTFRYGREKLQYNFPLENGEYDVDLYFIEPWLGRGGGLDCTGWRVFDVAVNDSVVIKDLDIWKEVRHNVALKKTVKAKVENGRLTISFPNIASGQAIISAIAISTRDSKAHGAPVSARIIGSLKVKDNKTSDSWKQETWLDIGDLPYTDSKSAFTVLPPDLYGAEWISTPEFCVANSDTLAEFTVSEDADVFIAVKPEIRERLSWLKEYDDTGLALEKSSGEKSNVYKKRFTKGSKVILGQNRGSVSQSVPMYCIAVNRASSMDPPYDLKISYMYEATKAKTEGAGITKEVINKKESVTFKGSAGAKLEWEIAVGVADTYALEIRYHNPTAKIMNGWMEMRAADGTLMKKEKVEFTPTRKGKWNYYNTTTGTMINAGNYKVVLLSERAENVSILALSVQ
jgi:beta-galactosidase